MEYTQVKRNKPIVSVIRNYVNKKSGKVSESRTEIQARFKGLDWKDQKKILAAFLSSGMSDRKWAYTHLLTMWDKAFETQIRELWEQYHEERCAWVVIRHLPADYLREHMDSFLYGRNYYFICRRLATDPSFVIDKSQLTEADFLSVLFHSGRKLTADEASATLRSLLRSVCLKPMYELGIRSRYVSRGTALSTTELRGVSAVVYYLSQLNQTDVVEHFELWDEQVQQNILQCPEFQKLNAENLSDFDYFEASVKLTQQYALAALDHIGELDWEQLKASSARYRQTAYYEEMLKQNPALEQLVQSFDLQASEFSEPPF